ncbi:AAA family ATPase [Streptomyces sp. MS1.AVA.1]|uniref:AAA family ATPase n=1 Tax=Streptomyces machairae TaxID=3134109 RepID=A0ABU8UJU0_9ACTN
MNVPVFQQPNGLCEHGQLKGACLRVGCPDGRTTYNALDHIGPAKAEETEAATSDLTFRHLAEVATDVDGREPRRFLFEPVIVEGDYGFLSAEDKAGKTWATIDAAVSCAAGLPWMGEFPCPSKGAVLVFFGEGSDAKLLRRIRAVGESKELSREATDALDIVVCFRAPKLSDAQHRHLIKRAIEEHKPKLVIVDPFYLTAGDAQGSSLYAMGALLGEIQRIAQDAGATLLISHHWNKTGTGDGHNRSSGVGPGAWGRFLISVSVVSTRTEERTKETAVIQKWQFRGDEIPDSAHAFLRRVRADDPHNLDSPLRYSVQLDAIPSHDNSGPHLKPSERKLLEALKSSDGQFPHTTKQIVDSVARKHGHGLTRETVSRGLARLTELGLVDQYPADSVGKHARWALTDKGAAHSV